MNLKGICFIIAGGIKQFREKVVCLSSENKFNESKKLHLNFFVKMKSIIYCFLQAILYVFEITQGNAFSHLQFLLNSVNESVVGGTGHFDTVFFGIKSRYFKLFSHVVSAKLV